MKKKRLTLFSTPIVKTVLRWISLLVLKLAGWKAEIKTDLPQKYVLIAIPHTSNWDFALMLPAVFVLRLDVHWMGKHTLFPWYAGWLMKFLGGIPIDRRKPQNTVEQMAEVFHNSDSLVLLITPEGTRSKVDRLKAGFYHIAREANVPIGLGILDAPSKHICIDSIFEPTGDYGADLPKILEVYKGKVGLRPDNTSDLG